MTEAVVNSLPEAEWLLIGETEAAALAEMSEDDLIDLHTRIRRARSKYVNNYRRGASARVRPVGGRGKAGPQGGRERDRAEVFEQALARVSTALSRAARRSAAELRAERIADAHAAKAGEGPGRSGAGSAGGSSARGSANTRRGDRSLVSPRSLKKGAGSAAAGSRRQAAKDSRHS